MSTCEHAWEVYDETDPYTVYAQCQSCGLRVWKTVAQETVLAEGMPAPGS